MTRSKQAAAVAALILLLGVVLAVRSTRSKPRTADSSAVRALERVGAEATEKTGGTNARLVARSGPSHSTARAADDVAERRRQLRELFLSVAASASADAGPSNAETPAGAGPRRVGVPDDVDAFAQAIAGAIRSDFAPMAQGCYEELLGRAPQAKGSVDMRFEILSDDSLGGVVNEAELAENSTLRDREFDTCLRESFLSLDFDSLRTPGRMTMRFPFEFADGKVDVSYEPHLKDRRPGRGGE